MKKQRKVCAEKAALRLVVRDLLNGTNVTCLLTFTNTALTLQHVPSLLTFHCPIVFSALPFCLFIWWLNNI